jgi:hypothetical protein
MEITASPSSAAESIMSFVSRARSFSQAVGFCERTFAAHVLISAVDQVGLDSDSREAFLAIASELSHYRPIELSQECSARYHRRMESLERRRARRQQRISEIG